MATIRERNGLFQVQIRLTGSKPATASFTTRKQAESWAMTTEAKLKAGLIEEPEIKTKKTLAKIKLGDLLDEYLSSFCPVPVMVQCGYNKVRNHPIFSLSLTEVGINQATELRDHLLKTVSPGTTKTYLRFVSNAYQYGKDRKNLSLGKNPFEGIIQARVKKRWVRFPESAYLKVMSLCEDELVRDCIDIAIETAMRRGEIISIGKKDILAGNFVYIPKTKTNKPRTIPLTAKAQTIVERRLEGPTERLFPIHGERLRRAFSKLCGQAGLSDIHFHDLRHEALTRLNNKGLSTTDLMLISGHTKAQCLSIYVNSNIGEVAKKIQTQ